MSLHDGNDPLFLLMPSAPAEDDDGAQGSFHFGPKIHDPSVSPIPERLLATVSTTAAGRAWLARLPAAVDDLRARWSLELGPPFDGPDVSAAWVAPARRTDGTSVVLKVPFPHFEAEQEADGLRHWDGDPTVRLLDTDETHAAMLLERCEPGTSLRCLPEAEQDEVIAGLLQRLWRAPTTSSVFRPLAVMTRAWSDGTRRARARWPDPMLVREGLRLMEELARPACGDVVLATDLHAGNVLAAGREPWLVIDPKPFVGDRAYDATQHLLNCRHRLHAAPRDTACRFADLLELDVERVQKWLFARVAAEPRARWDEESLRLARALAQ